MTDREKVVERLGRVSYYFKSLLAVGWQGDADTYREHRESVNMAIAMLKEQKTHILTIDHLEDALDTVVWLETPMSENLTDGYSLIMAYSHKCGWMLFDSPFGDNPSQDRLEYSEYGKSWRCWNKRPTDEQRQAVKWE